MTDLTLIIGNMNLSSWSLRPWIAMRHCDIPFKTVKILLDRPESREALRKASPSARVPALRHGDRLIWDSLAILEYVNELFPEKGLWPDDPAARANARAVSAEMHAGFQELRTLWPMQAARRDMRHLASVALQRDIERITALWTEARSHWGAHTGEPFLYGRFTIADAMYAPVASRFATYGPLNLPAVARDYMDALLTLPAMRAWIDGAQAELAEAPA